MSANELENIFAASPSKPDVEEGGTIESEGKPKKRRGRPPGSGKAKESKRDRPSIEIDRQLVSSFVNVIFSAIVSYTSNRWRPLDSEIAAISGNLALVIEKRAPDAVIENLPEYMLAASIVAYLGRCYVTGTETPVGVGTSEQ